MKTGCLVLKTIDDEWKDLVNLFKDVMRGFIIFAPDLFRTPGTTVYDPNEMEDVTERIESEERSINISSRIQETMSLRDCMFTERAKPFQ